MQILWRFPSTLFVSIARLLRFDIRAKYLVIKHPLIWMAYIFQQQHSQKQRTALTYSTHKKHDLSYYKKLCIFLSSVCLGYKWPIILEYNHLFYAARSTQHSDNPIQKCEMTASLANHSETQKKKYRQRRRKTQKVCHVDNSSSTFYARKLTFFTRLRISSMA